MTDQSAVYVRFSPGNDAWCVMGANLPSSQCWSLHDTEIEARDAAAELADDLGVTYDALRGI